ncbi:MAG TPA: SDR family oxidoreductase [Rhizomicrobium sp.]|jgi:NAD(P)-dependent dehydrogenase (short-subunit alcohol dehydrogenase family)|nr:SDR family oxidoreductase [Rhizomicrobium sp.]
MKTVVITGASTGIGRACAKMLVQKGFHVFGSVRKQVDADGLSLQLGASFSPLIFDITDSAAVQSAAAALDEWLGGKPLFGLVSNAGIAVPGPLLHLDVDGFRRQLEVNVTGQLIVTQSFAPLLRTADGNRTGRIVMMSSIGGRNASPFIGAYNASKFALEGLSESLRRELMLWGIDVIIVAPGAIATPIWDKAEEVDLSAYVNTAYAASLDTVRDYMLANGRKGLKPEQVAGVVWRALTVARPKTRYVITPDPLQNFLANHLPKRMVDRMIARQLGLLPKK